MYGEQGVVGNQLSVDHMSSHMSLGNGYTAEDYALEGYILRLLIGMLAINS